MFSISPEPFVGQVNRATAETSHARAQDPGQAAQIDVAYVGAGILTVDEVRANLGLAPLAQAPKPVTPAVKKTYVRTTRARVTTRKMRMTNPVTVAMMATGVTLAMNPTSTLPIPAGPQAPQEA